MMKLNIEQRKREASELVMIHGLTRRWQTFTPLLPSFSSRYSLTLIDLPGHGESPANTSGYNVLQHAEAVVRWIDHFNVERFDLYGHSLGAMVALHAAAKRPDRVSRVILEDPPFGTMGDRLEQTVWLSHFSQVHEIRNREEFIRGNRREQVEMLGNILLKDPVTGSTQRLGTQRDPSSLRFMAACMLKMDASVVEPVVRKEWYKDWHWESIATEVTQPTLILRADEKAGGMLTEHDCNHLCSLLEDPVPVFFQNSGHNLHWVRTVDLSHSVHTFLDS
ncbi:MAG: alpha/beta hydrolase [Planctomycetaceae bacterium]|nr:alpha/beta hydrolase [Planctomycetaceae bacterium]